MLAMNKMDDARTSIIKNVQTCPETQIRAHAAR